MKKVLIYGFGNIGKRHFESILKKNLDTFIYIFDKDKETFRYFPNTKK